MNKNYLKLNLEIGYIDNVYISEEYADIDFNAIQKKRVSVDIEGTASCKYIQKRINEEDEEEIEIDGYELFFDGTVNAGTPLSSIFCNIENIEEYNALYTENDSDIEYKKLFSLTDIVIDKIIID